MRIKPSKNQFIVGKLNRGDQVNIFSRRQDWYQIESPKVFEGWIFKKYFKYYMSVKDYQLKLREEKS